MGSGGSFRTPSKEADKAGRGAFKKGKIKQIRGDQKILKAGKMKK